MALADGTVGAVRVGSFLPDHIHQALLGRLVSHLTRYDQGRYPVDAYRFGPTLNEYQDRGSLHECYWDSAEESDQIWKHTMSGLHTKQHIVAQLSNAWEGMVGPASIHGRPTYWPIIREISSGTLLHWDDILREYPNGVFDQKVKHQFAMNIFITTPSTGGELRIWRRKWQPDDDACRLAFGYQARLLGGTPDAVVSARQGDAVLFKSQYYHDVLPSTGGRRITLSLFIGMAENGSLVMWS